MTPSNEPPSPLDYRSSEADVRERKRRREVLVDHIRAGAEFPALMIAVIGCITFAFAVELGHFRLILIPLLLLMGISYILARLRHEPDDVWRLIRKLVFVVAFLVLICVLNTDGFGWAMYEFTHYGTRARLTPASQRALYGVGASVGLLLLLEVGCVFAPFHARQHRRPSR